MLWVHGLTSGLVACRHRTWDECDGGPVPHGRDVSETPLDVLFAFAGYTCLSRNVLTLSGDRRPGR